MDLLTYLPLSRCTVAFTLSCVVDIYRWLKLRQIYIRCGILDQCQEWTSHVQAESAAAASGWRQTRRWTLSLHSLSAPIYQQTSLIVTPHSHTVCVPADNR